MRSVFITPQMKGDTKWTLQMLWSWFKYVWIDEWWNKLHLFILLLKRWMMIVPIKLMSTSDGRIQNWHGAMLSVPRGSILSEYGCWMEWGVNPLIILCLARGIMNVPINGISRHLYNKWRVDSKWSWFAESPIQSEGVLSEYWCWMDECQVNL